MADDFQLMQKIAETFGDFRAFETQGRTGESGGWLPDGDIWTYASASTFTIVGDVSDKFGQGDRVRFKQSASTWQYGKVSATASYSSGTGLTTITVTMCAGSALANETITEPGYSKAWIPQGFPLSAAGEAATVAMSGDYDETEQSSAANNTTYQDTTIDVPVTVSAASYITVTCSFKMKVNNGTGSYRLVLGSTAISDTVTTTSTSYGTTTLNGARRVAAGTYHVKLQFHGSSGSGYVAYVDDAYLVVTVGPA